jgi:cytochrome P450
MRLPPSPTEERTLEFWGRYFEDPGDALRALHAELGPVFRVPTPGGRTVNVLVGAEAVDRVLAREHEGFRMRGAFGYLREVAENTLVGQDGEHAQRLRRLIMPALRKARIDRYLDHMLATMERELDRWPTGEPFELARAMRDLTLQVATHSFLDLDVDDERFDAIAEAITTMAEYASPAPRAVKEERRPAFLEAKGVLFGFIDEVVADRRAGEIDRGDILSALVLARDEEGSELDPDELRDKVWGLMFAGHDTTAHGTAWALMLLAEHPAERGRALAELRAGRPPTDRRRPRAARIPRPRVPRDAAALPLRPGDSAHRPARVRDRRLHHPGR